MRCCYDEVISICEIFQSVDFEKMAHVKIVTDDIKDRKGCVIEKSVEIDIDRDVALKMATIANIIEDLGESQESIPISNVKSSALLKIVEYYRHRLDNPDDNEWFREFFKVPTRTSSSIEQIRKRNRELADILNSANYLEADELVKQTAKAIAKTLKNKTPEQIREEWELPDDLTEEEKKQIEKDNKWCLDMKDVMRIPAKPSTKNTRK